jgi:hypothetical protein
MLRRIFGPNKNVNSRLGKLCNEKLHNLYSSPDIIRVIKWRRKQDRHVAHTREIKMYQDNFSWKPEDLGVDVNKT